MSERNYRALHIRLNQAVESLDDWVRRQGWIGYDPYDIKATPAYRRLQKNRLTALTAKAAVNLFPLSWRKIFRVQAQPHAKAMALFAEAYLTLLDFTGYESYRAPALECLHWLRKNASPAFSNIAWGLPFDYQGRDHVPAGTPSAVITAIAASAFLHAFQTIKDPIFLETAASAGRFLAEDLPRYKPNKHQLCFSKMPAVRWYIHNSNLMVAAILVQIEQAANTNRWTDIARQAVNYSLAEQLESGAWYYWGPPEHLMHWIDHYHTGFVLRALDDLYTSTGWEDLREALDRGYRYYVNHLFADRRIPRLTETSRYPVDIHSCAEAILCLSQLANRYDDALDRALAVADWTLDHMRHPDGFFFYRRYRFLTIKIPYMRWGQAWMLAALTRLQRTLGAGNFRNME